jgi:hypothetical protein
MLKKTDKVISSQHTLSTSPLKTQIMKYLSIIIFIFASSLSFSLPVDKKTAEKVAVNFMQRVFPDKGNYTLAKTNTQYINGTPTGYVIEFKSGGFIIIPADDAIIPVLAFSNEGRFDKTDIAPATEQMYQYYNEAVWKAIQERAPNTNTINKWDILLEEHTTKEVDDTIVAPLIQTRLGQSKTNDGECPGYNHYITGGKESDCSDDCDNCTVGCGAVAMGQIMRYWAHPVQAGGYFYDWCAMPEALIKLDANDNIRPEYERERNTIAHLLKDCGDASDMTYQCLGSWTTVNKIEEAFKDEFNYKGVKKHVRTDWEYGSAWLDLLRSEIDNERPVFYRGDKSDLSTSKHFFVLDGYDASDPDFFWFNFGWGYPGNSYNTSRHYLNDITPGDHEYNKNQMTIVGISPTYTELAPENVNVFDVSFSNVFGIKNEDAQQNIALPATGKELVVESGGELTLTAGNSIILKPGFHAKSGSKLRATINPDYTEEMDINVSSWYNVFTPNGDGINDELCFDVENANSWEFSAIDRYHNVVFQSAGSITGNNVCVWDGAGAYCNNAYRCIIRFKNNYGRVAENDYMVSVYCDTKSTSASNDSLLYKYPEVKKNATNSSNQNSETLFTAYPNPCNSFNNLKFADNSKKIIKIYNSQGILCFQTRKINSPDFRIDMRAFTNGLYVICLETDNEILTKQIIIER